MDATQHEPISQSEGARLHICHLGKFYPPAPGGIESHVQALAKAQAELGAEVEVLCVNHASATGEDVSWTQLGRSADSVTWDDAVLVHRVGRIAGAGRYEVCPSLWSALRQAVARADVVHVHAPNATMFVALLGQRLPGKLVVAHHSDILRFPPLARAFAPLERHVLRRASLVIASSEQYVAGSPVLRSVAHKVRILPLGLDLEPFAAPSAASKRYAEELSAKVGGPLWLAVGRHVPYKGIEVALRALVTVPGKLVAVGQGPLSAELRSLARTLGLESRVVWLNRLDQTELAGAYLAARALWFPSVERSEAFGLVQVEAMAAGCPVVNTFVPGSAVPWVSPHDVSGLTVPVGDAAALAAAARELLNDATRERLSRGARARARAEFSAELMGRRSFELYRAALPST